MFLEREEWELQRVVPSLAGNIGLSNLHISNKNRRISVLTPLLAKKNKISIHKATFEITRHLSSGWVATVSLNGSRAHIDSRYQSILRQFRSSVSIVYREELEKHSAGKYGKLTKSSFLHACGIPSDDSVYSLGFGQNELVSSNPEASNSGTLFLVPVLPFAGAHVERVLSIVESEFKKSDFPMYATFNLVELSSLEAVLNLTFDSKDQERVEEAHRTILKAFRHLVRAGYHPQRMSVFQMSHYRGMDHV